MLSWIMNLGFAASPAAAPASVPLHVEMPGFKMLRLGGAPVSMLLLWIMTYGRYH